MILSVACFCVLPCRELLPDLSEDELRELLPTIGARNKMRKYLASLQRPARLEGQRPTAVRVIICAQNFSFLKSTVAKSFFLMTFNTMDILSRQVYLSNCFDFY